MKKLNELTYGIVGLGLMGGSIAKSIRENILSSGGATGKVYASTRNVAALELAKSQCVLDEFYTLDKVDEMLALCDFVFVCFYPHMTVDFLAAQKNAFKKGSVVTDINGVKAEIFDRLAEIESENYDFIPGHPMAGGEKEGYAASNAAFFKNHNYILMPLASNKAENVEQFKRLITEMGFTQIVETDGRVHDHKIAFTSQLCHVIASALVNSAEDVRVTQFGGGSFEDLTRIAMINAPLWTELFLANKAELVGHIEKFEKSLEVLKECIKNDKAEETKAYLEEVRVKRIEMSRKDVKVEK
nr:prephenate dehydrogenase [uncultured Treponema sp.]